MKCRCDARIGDVPGSQIRSVKARKAAQARWGKWGHPRDVTTTPNTRASCRCRRVGCLKPSGPGRRSSCEQSDLLPELSRPIASLNLWLSLVALNPPERHEWKGLVLGRVKPTTGPSMRLRLPMPAGASWSSPIRINATDGADYFAKFPESCMNHPKDGMSVAIEMIAAECGRLIGAPVCDTVLLRVPAAF
jgi:hypothetical protein